MWSRYFQMKERESGPSQNYSNPAHGNSGPSHNFLQDKRADMGLEFGTSKNRKAHMDEEPERETYWMRELEKVEQADPDRYKGKKMLVFFIVMLKKIRVGGWELFF